MKPIIYAYRVTKKERELSPWPTVPKVSAFQLSQGNIVTTAFFYLSYAMKTASKLPTKKQNKGETEIKMLCVK